MKTTNTLLTLLASSLSAFIFGQTTNFQVSASDSLPTCTNAINFYAEIGSVPETGGIVYVDWGDGSTEQFNFTTTTQNYHYDHFQHIYAASGYYTGNVQVWSTVSNSYVGNTQNFTVQAGDQNSCGYASVAVQSSVGLYGVPIDFTGSDAVTTTISPAAYSYGYYSGLNPANAPYTVSINDAWLVAHNYTQTSGDLQIPSFNTDGYGGHLTFAISCGTATVDADIDVNEGIFGVFVAPQEAGWIDLKVCNSSCSGPVDTDVALTFESFLVPDLTNPIMTIVSNPLVTGNVLSFELENLEGCEWIHIPFTFPGTTVAGTPVSFTVNASIAGTDLDLSNNTETFTTEVLNSYDPNNKLVNKGQYIDHTVKEELRYMINFQNEGNYPALNVKVKDTLSTNLDLSTFRLLGTSHNATYTMDATSRVVTFSFPMIDLQPVSQDEAGSKGHIIYAISEMPGLPLNSEIKNTAYIYFDFNPAIITNTTSNINSVLGVNENSMDLVSIYPNPASGKITLEGKGITEVQIIDFTGKTVLKQLAGSTLNVSSLPEGIYLVQVTTEVGNSAQKLVIRH